MTIPQVSLLVAFAIGLPLGIAGYFLQEAVIRRRRRRAHAAVEAGSGWGTHAGPRPEGTRTGVGTAVTGHAGTAAHPAEAPAELDQPPVEDAEPVAEAEVAPVAAALGTTELVAIQPARPGDPGATARKRRLALLRKQDADMQLAVEALVEFIEAPPRKARASAAAEVVTTLIPRARRGAALVAFLDGVAGGATPSASQDAAEAAGIEIARELRVVKQELLELEAG